MLTLSQLVELKISTVVLLEKDNIVESINNFCAILSTYTKDKKDNFLQIDSVIDNTLLEYDKIKYQSDSIKNKLNVIIENINVAIEEEINKLNHSDVFKKTFDTGWSNIFLLDTAVNNLIEITIGKYVDCSYPGLRLGCRHVGQKEINILTQDNQWLKDYEYSKAYSNCLVACDPLYFCDIDKNLINSTTDHFNDIYNQRIRLYLLCDLDKLPIGQFGFIFSWMFLNYVDRQTCEIYLKQIYDLLRPGGVIMFSYNNVDFAESAKIAELGVMSAISKKHLLKYTEKLGFSCINSYDVSNSDIVLKKISWLELRKSGTLSTIKRSQVLGQVI